MSAGADRARAVFKETYSNRAQIGKKSEAKMKLKKATVSAVVCGIRY